MKDFWIAELEEGKIESLLNVESKDFKIRNRNDQLLSMYKMLQLQDPLRDKNSSKLMDIRDLKIKVWPSYCKRQTAVCS